MADIKKNLENIQFSIREACKKSHRDNNEVHILAVSKKQPIEKIYEAIKLGQKDFGENYLQEALEKMEQLKEENIDWHFIGRIQTNKINKMVGAFTFIHSVDRLEILEKISQISKQKNIMQKVFLQINIGEEITKGGFHESNFVENWPALASLPHVQICGLMTLPPLCTDPEEARPYFKKLRQMQEKIKKSRSSHPLSELSMGTSHDFREAIEEGATWLRIGTSLFGARS